MKAHYHFMGIGGISMGSLARHLQAEGYRVSGCDGADGRQLDSLRNQGIGVHHGHHPAHLDGVDVLVTTMAVPSPTVPASQTELTAAQQAGIRVMRRIELLAQLFEERKAIGVSGSHGKSTTSAMLATIALELDPDPSIQLGAVLPVLGGAMRHGRSPLLIAEVDESDPGFARLRPDIAVVTNLEDDHVAGDFQERRNYHASLADLEGAMLRFGGAARKLVANADCPNLATLFGGREVVWFGLASTAQLRIAKLELQHDGSRFELATPDGPVSVRLSVPGRHNAANATAALAAAWVLGWDLGRAAAALASFPGVGRRWQHWGQVRGALVVDDYAHHPTEIAATLDTARDTGRRIRAVLQPHRWVRTARLWPQLADAARRADEVLVLDVYAAGEEAIPGVSPDMIVQRLRENGTTASRHDHASAIRYLSTSLLEGDLVVTLGAGDVWRIAAALVNPPEAGA